MYTRPDANDARMLALELVISCRRCISMIGTNAKLKTAARMIAMKKRDRQRKWDLILTALQLIYKQKLVSPATNQDNFGNRRRRPLQSS